MPDLITSHHSRWGWLAMLILPATLSTQQAADGSPVNSPEHPLVASLVVAPDSTGVQEA